MIMRSNPTNPPLRARSAQLGMSINQPHPQLIQTQDIDDGDIPFSEILLLLEELGTDAGLAIETAQLNLFDLEALLSFNILHDDGDDDGVMKADRLPRHDELYQKGVVLALVYLLFHVSRSVNKM